MGTKVKGFLKPFKYISNNVCNMFEDQKKEEEMQIGLPTDVKHVAHIGLDDEASNAKPTWMEDYKSAPELAPNNPPPSAVARSISAESVNLPEVVPPEKQKPPKDSKTSRRKHKDKDKDKDKEGSSSHHRHRRSKDAKDGTSDTSGSSKHSRRRKSKASKGQSDSDPQFPTFPQTDSDPTLPQSP